MNKTVLITGATSNIGEATARLFASNNYDVILHYHNSLEEAKRIKKELELDFNVKCTIVKADISNEEEVKEMFSNITKLDCLVNNAALAMDNNYLDKTKDEFNKVIETNLTGTFLVTKYASKVMEDGSIINVSSNNAINDSSPLSMDYDASKAGIISLTHNFAKELAPDIRVNAVAPGWVLTFPIKQMDTKYLDEQVKKVLIGFLAAPEDIANVIYFLASDEARYINDEVIRVDGGLK